MLFDVSQREVKKNVCTLVTNKGEHSIFLSKERKIDMIGVRKRIKHSERCKIVKSETPLGKI